MTEDEMKTREQLEKLVTVTLERRPEIAIPGDFAARVTRAMPVKETSPGEARPIFGRLAGYLAASLMMIVLVVLAWMFPESLAAGRGFLFGVELLLVAQLLAVGYWLGVRGEGSGRLYDVPRGTFAQGVTLPIPL